MDSAGAHYSSVNTEPAVGSVGNPVQQAGFKAFLKKNNPGAEAIIDDMTEAQLRARFVNGSKAWDAMQSTLDEEEETVEVSY